MTCAAEVPHSKLNGVQEEPHANHWQPYPEYQDSGIEWLGEIPAHWEVKKLKHIAHLKSGDSITSDNIQENGEYPVYGGNGLRGYTDSYTHQGDYILIGRQGALCGNIQYASGYFWASEHAVVVFSKTNEEHLLWFGELLRAMNLNQYSLSAAQPGIAVERIQNLPIPVPPIEETYSIGKFLDHQTAQIDALIEKKQQLIDLLHEQRSAIISHAVTKGLDPDVPMKDSGIEWLGEIPAHWEVNKLKHLTSKIGSGKTPKGGSEVYTSTGIVFLRSQNIHFDGLRLEDVVYITLETHTEMSSTQVLPDDVLLNITGASLGRCTIFPASLGEANVSQHVCILRPISQRILPELLVKIVASDYIQTQIFSGENGTSREGLNFAQASNLLIPISLDLEEQQTIAAFLDHQTAKIDALIEKTTETIEILQEYRTSLISAAVTGKIDVREWQEQD